MDLGRMVTLEVEDGGYWMASGTNGPGGAQGKVECTTGEFPLMSQGGGIDGPRVPRAVMVFWACAKLLSLPVASWGWTRVGQLVP